jgi:hypothetical protein
MLSTYKLNNSLHEIESTQINSISHKSVKDFKMIKLVGQGSFGVVR